jgi:hypothetical protein
MPNMKKFHQKVKGERLASYKRPQNSVKNEQMDKPNKVDQDDQK